MDAPPVLSHIRQSVAAPQYVSYGSLGVWPHRTTQRISIGTWLPCTAHHSFRVRMLGNAHCVSLSLFVPWLICSHHGYTTRRYVMYQSERSRNTHLLSPREPAILCVSLAWSVTAHCASKATVSVCTLTLKECNELCSNKEPLNLLIWNSSNVHCVQVNLNARSKMIFNLPFRRLQLVGGRNH